MRLRAVFAVCLSLVLAAPVAAQDESLADIRTELTALYRDILSVKSLLDPTGLRAGTSLSDNTLERVISIETSLQRLTARAEELEFRINRIVADGTNRVGDLEFRLCELEPSCDIGTLGETPLLGGADLGDTTPAFTGLTPTDAEELALTERNDFERAQVALSEGRYADAEDLFDQFVQTYPGGPLGVQAQLGRGQALEALERPRDAARAYLEAFSLNNDGPQAPVALLQLGRMLAQMSQLDEACIMLGEVGRRFPESSASLEAGTEMARLACP